MKDEIKEILEQLKIRNDLYNDRDESCIVPIEYYEAHILLDYITNLQEENEKLKIEKQEEYNRFNLMAKFRDRALERTLIYKSRNEKAIKYIEEYQEVLKEHNGDWLNYQDGFKPYLLNILQGEDKE